MDDPNSKPEKPKAERRYDPELLKKGLRCDLDQYDFLKQCSEKGEEGIKEWNHWRSEKQNRHKDIQLEGAALNECYFKNIDLGLKGLYISEGLDKKVPSKVFLTEAHLKWAKLQGASLRGTHLEGAEMEFAHLEDADISDTNLEGANLLEANLRGAYLTDSKLQGADFSRAIVDGGTLIWTYEVDRETKFEGVGLDAARIYPRTKQLLECNVRRMNWEEWYQFKDWYQYRPKDKRNNFSRIFLKNTVGWFWWISDYGISTKRIVYTFFRLAFIFALLYRIFPNFVKVYGIVGDIRGFWHALYFSVVTMTTLGFGDIVANPDSWVGQTLLMVQVILGYVLLGALVTRFAVLFTAGGPAGKFADDKEKEDEKK
jgi:hypothetical protein